MKYLLDTHIWIWYHMNPEKLSGRIKALISDPESYEILILSAISIWEFSKLIEKKKLIISCDPLQWIYQALDMVRLQLLPLSPAIAYNSTRLPQPFHDDPADQIIAASAIEESAVLITKDKLLLDYPYIETIW